MNRHRSQPNGPRTPVAAAGAFWFAAVVFLFVAIFVGWWTALFTSDVAYTNWDAVGEVLGSPEIREAAWLSCWTTVVSTLIGLVFSIPMGYALSRYRFPGRVLVETFVDLPIVLPPLIVGLTLLVFFGTYPGRWIETNLMEFVFSRNGIILCQVLVSASFGIRIMQLTFDGIDPRFEHVAMTLGSSRAGAFFRVSLPMARRGIITAAIIMWTRAFGIYGPLTIFVGSVRMRTEVLPTTIYLEQSVGKIEVALAVALAMIALATLVLVTVRLVGLGVK